MMKNPNEAHIDPHSQDKEIKHSILPNWLEGLLSYIYEFYLTIFKVDTRVHTIRSINPTMAMESHQYIGALDQKKIDFRATRTGSAYRGIGILIGFLGSAIILCALLPVGIKLSSTAATIVSASEFILMAILLIIIFATRKMGLKEQWVDLRRTAEYNRYMKLKKLITCAEVDQSEESIGQLKVEIGRHIGGGAECQIIYNQKRRTVYEGIEAFSTRLTYIAFSLSFAGAAAHLVFHQTWLIFLTAYAPSLVGAMHAVNSFLRLPQLIEQHGEMVLFLTNLRDQFPTDTSGLDSRNKFLLLSRNLRARLINADESWFNIAAHQNIHPV